MFLLHPGTRWVKREFRKKRQSDFLQEQKDRGMDVRMLDGMTGGNPSLWAGEAQGSRGCPWIPGSVQAQVGRAQNSLG